MFYYILLIASFELLLLIIFQLLKLCSKVIYIWTLIFLHNKCLHSYEFSLTISLAMFYKFWWLCSHSHFFFRNFLNSILISSMAYCLFSNKLLNFQEFELFLNYFGGHSLPHLLGPIDNFVDYLSTLKELSVWEIDFHPLVTFWERPW